MQTKKIFFLNKNKMVDTVIYQNLSIYFLSKESDFQTTFSTIFVLNTHNDFSHLKWNIDSLTLYGMT